MKEAQQFAKSRKKFLKPCTKIFFSALYGMSTIDHPNDIKQILGVFDPHPPLSRIHATYQCCLSCFCNFGNPSP